MTFQDVQKDTWGDRSKSLAPHDGSGFDRYPF